MPYTKLGFLEKQDFGVGTLPQARFFVKKLRFGAGTAFFLSKSRFLVLERCRRRLFL